MEVIAAEAGITKPVLYRHFGDKDGLYEALAERYVKELKHTLQPASETDRRARPPRGDASTPTSSTSSASPSAIASSSEPQSVHAPPG